ncbi:hypothetical protein H310_01409 [Aphanomyces invadans]|uniref:Mnd1 HTH domain-containing protein n=1 Tax=Aphanomyces invadans TaxID=157072 RepID=A0A024USL8_9STRA|nr:hypothetical protein H310_01409 [Aphanomyces invadans]ETW08925.1 hypothetical protein H310_01409 [Aphanomyces invadans]|eukprot:XP_008862730.1 hypothetical protein H310_01409 [Aphanomyces invadans]
MSKRKKGVSLDEKRERILKLYHENLEVYNLKEVEKLGSKAGVVLQTIKDVNQALVDDNLVDTEKIGSGNYFWSFPSKVAQQRKRKLEDLEAKRTELKAKIESTKHAVEARKSVRADSDDRVVKLERLAQLRSDIEAANQRLHVMSENDPDLMKKLGTTTRKRPHYYHVTPCRQQSESRQRRCGPLDRQRVQPQSLGNQEEQLFIGRG